MKRNDIQILKSSLRIEEVIGRYVRLDRHGNSYTGLCPFHADHHASLSVSTERQTFTCFACGEKGDVFAFVEKMEHCSFGEAAAKLGAEQANHSGGTSSRPPLEREQDACNSSGPRTVKDNTNFLQSLLPYASGNSELSGSYIDFEVGQSPARTPREWYAMSNRIIFPIRNESGVLVGFAARRLNDSDTKTPKYINSSARDSYNKGETLYGLYRAKEAIRKEGMVFITEGYKDAIAMHAAGFVNTVALSGTALTTAHISLIKKYTDRAYLLLDSDEAGRTASRKAQSLLLAARIEADSISLPEGEDPDSLFRKWGKKAFAAVIRRSVDKPHSSESGLLTACLLFPDAVYPFKEGSCRFAELLYGILPADGLSFENKTYWQILRHLAGGATEASLPPSLSMVADELHMDFDHFLHRDLELLAVMLPEADNRTTIYLGRLFFLYTEVRLLRQIRREVKRLLCIPPGNSVKRAEILIYIAGRRELLRHVSECLERAGVVMD